VAGKLSRGQRDAFRAAARRRGYPLTRLNSKYDEFLIIKAALSTFP